MAKVRLATRGVAIRAASVSWAGASRSAIRKEKATGSLHVSEEKTG